MMKVGKVIQVSQIITAPKHLGLPHLPLFFKYVENTSLQKNHLYIELFLKCLLFTTNQDRKEGYLKSREFRIVAKLRVLLRK